MTERLSLKFKKEESNFVDFPLNELQSLENHQEDIKEYFEKNGSETVISSSELLGYFSYILYDPQFSFYFNGTSKFINYVEYYSEYDKSIGTFIEAFLCFRDFMDSYPILFRIDHSSYLIDIAAKIDDKIIFFQLPVSFSKKMIQNQFPMKDELSEMTLSPNLDLNFVKEALEIIENYKLGETDGIIVQDLKKG